MMLSSLAAQNSKPMNSSATGLPPTGVAFTEYGSYWRSERKLCALEIFSIAKVNSFASVRKEAAGLLVKSVKEMAAVGEVVDISGMVAGIVEDLAYRT